MPAARPDERPQVGQQVAQALGPRSASVFGGLAFASAAVRQVPARKSPIRPGRSGPCRPGTSRGPGSRRAAANVTSRPARAQHGRDLLLLVEREQEVGLDADHQRPPRADAGEARLHRAAVLGHVEQVHRARQVEVAVRRRRCPRTCARASRGRPRSRTRRRRRPSRAVAHVHPLAAEPLPPLRGRAVGDEARACARARSPVDRARRRRVVAALPLGVGADGLALHRADGDRERRGAGGAGDGDEGVHLVREQDRVGERGHAAERRAHHRAQARRCPARAAPRGRRSRCPRWSAPGRSGGSARPCAGSTEAAPVEPWQLPSEFTQITWKRSVSMAWPGPTISSHQPGEGSSADEARVRPGREAGDEQQHVVLAGGTARPRSRRRCRPPAGRRRCAW